MDSKENTLRIIYDNISIKPGLIPAWGFSCLISSQEQETLFDTGGDLSVLMHNLRMMNVPPDKIRGVILSHAHWDHAGGLSGFLREAKGPTVYLPASFPESYKKEAARGAGKIEETHGPGRIHTDLYTTGELGDLLKEQSIVLKTREGLVLITGCAHPGVTDIVGVATRRFQAPVHLLVGGLHLMDKTSKKLESIARELEEKGVKRIAPCHCSGDTARDIFENYFGDNFIPGGAGTIIGIPGPPDGAP